LRQLDAEPREHTGKEALGRVRARKKSRANVARFLRLRAHGFRVPRKRSRRQRLLRAGLVRNRCSPRCPPWARARVARRSTFCAATPCPPPATALQFSLPAEASCLRSRRARAAKKACIERAGSCLRPGSQCSAHRRERNRAPLGRSTAARYLSGGPASERSLRCLLNAPDRELPSSA
jgi:hypothetical protein